MASKISRIFGIDLPIYTKYSIQWDNIDFPTMFLYSTYIELCLNLSSIYTVIICQFSTDWDCDRVLMKLFIFGIKSIYFSFRLSSYRWDKITRSTESIFASMSRLLIKPKIQSSAYSSFFPIISPTEAIDTFSYTRQYIL